MTLSASLQRCRGQGLPSLDLPQNLNQIDRSSSSVTSCPFSIGSQPPTARQQGTDKIRCRFLTGIRSAHPRRRSRESVLRTQLQLVKKERPFSLEVFRHTGHNGHLLFTAELPTCSRNAETPKTVSRCMVSGRFWAFSFDMSGFILAALSLSSVIQNPLFVASG